jgi:hypothetical protein
MKYRIIIRDSDLYPFEVQRGVESKFLWWVSVHWTFVGMEDTQSKAEQTIRDDIRKQEEFKMKVRLAPGTVVKEYDESDLIVDKLKGK